MENLLKNVESKFLVAYKKAIKMSDACCCFTASFKEYEIRELGISLRKEGIKLSEFNSNINTFLSERKKISSLRKKNDNPKTTIEKIRIFIALKEKAIQKLEHKYLSLFLTKYNKEKSLFKAINYDKHVNCIYKELDKLITSQNDEKRFMKNLQNSKMVSSYKTHTRTYDSKKHIYYVNSSTYAIIDCDTTSDWNYYAKSYGYPKNTISNRRVDFFQFLNGKIEKVHSFALVSFAGDFMENALLSFYNISEKLIKIQKGLLSVQLKKCFTLKNEECEIKNYLIFSRNIGATLWDYCLLDDKGNTYHHFDKNELLAGLQTKLNSTVDTSKKLTFEYVTQKLGFCYEGTLQFCEINGIDINGNISINKLKEIVLANKKSNAHFKNELAKLGINI